MNHAYHIDSRSLSCSFPGSCNTAAAHSSRYSTHPLYQKPQPQLRRRKRTRAQFETPVFTKLPYQNHRGHSFTQLNHHETAPLEFRPAYGNFQRPIASSVPNPKNLAVNPRLFAPVGPNNQVPISQGPNGHFGRIPGSTAAQPPPPSGPPPAVYGRVEAADALKNLPNLLVVPQQADQFLAQKATPFLQGRVCNFALNPAMTIRPSLPHGLPPISAGTELITGISATPSVGNLLNALLAQQPTPIAPQKRPLFTVQEEKEEEPLGFDFDPAKLKRRNESAIRALYSDLPRQCATCGMRFKMQEEHRNHMDQHLRKNRESNNLKKKQMNSRKWFLPSDLTIVAAVAEASNANCPFFKGLTRQEETSSEEAFTVSGDQNQRECALCKEAFEEFWSDEKEDWLYRGAVYMNLRFGSTEEIDRSQLGPIVHAKCIAKPC